MGADGLEPPTFLLRGCSFSELRARELPRTELHRRPAGSLRRLLCCWATREEDDHPCESTLRSPLSGVGLSMAGEDDHGETL